MSERVKGCPSEALAAAGREKERWRPRWERPCLVCGTLRKGEGRDVCPGECARARKTALQKQRRLTARRARGLGDE